MFSATYQTAFLVLALAVSCLAANDDVTIVVNLGSYPSAQAAGTDEESVNWLDADLRDDAICTEAFAAAELQRYLRKMAGRPEAFPVVDDDALPEGDLVLIGGPASNAASKKLAPKLGVSAGEITKLGPEGYRIKTVVVDGRALTLIAGGGRVGTLYGVYDVLYRMGCRWFAPGETHEEIPNLKLDRLPDFDVTEQPKFFTRGFHAWENRGNPDFLIWMARNRLNYWCVEQEGHPLLRKLGVMLVWGGHIIQSNYLFPHDPYPYNHPNFKDDDDKPKDPYPVSGSFRGDANKDGKLSYFEAHPEWYALRGGKRSSNISRWGGGDNYCTSNKEATDELMKNVMPDLIDGKFKDADVINCWMLDGGRWCECEKCKALGTSTDRNLLFVHRFDKEIKKAQAAGRINRTIRLLFLAYADVLEPPTRPLPEDFDYETCIATYFPIVRCYVHNFDDPDCSKNARYNKHLYGWALDPDRHYKGQICIGEYYNVSGYKCLPICYMHTMQNDIPYYYRIGARHFHYMHCTTGQWGNKALTNYQMARQLWDPATDCEALWDDYFSKRYGRAAQDMRRFYESLEKMLCNVSELKYGLAPRLNRGSKNLFPTSHLKYEKTTFEKDDGPDLLEILDYARRCREIIDKVRGADLPKRIAERVAEDERMFTYGERTLKFFDALARAYFAIRKNQKNDARTAYSEAKGLADQLRADTTSTKMSSSHANAPDALSASRASGALSRLEAILGPAEPSEAKAFDVEKGELVLTGRDFWGGGATRYGYQLNVFPGRKKVSDHGNYVYAKPASPYDRMTAWFRLDQSPKAPLYLNMVGLSCPQPPGGRIPAQVYINGTLIFSGDAPFPETELGSREIRVQPDVFKKGLNKIEIRNAAAKGPVGNRPWFGVHQVELRTSPQNAAL